ncbi:MAG: hypothetical protein ACRC14_11135 [Paracoccaceae bacterium]
MPYILGVLALAGVAYMWVIRMRNAAEMTHELANVASDVMAAARRLGFRRRLNSHPVDGLEDANVAIAGAGIAFLELGGLPTAEQQNGLTIALQSHLAESHDLAKEQMILGRWLVSESGGAPSGFDRLTRRLFKLQGAEGFKPLLAVLQDVAQAGSTGLSTRQKEALEGLSRTFRLT